MIKSKVKEWCKDNLTHNEYMKVVREMNLKLDIGHSMFQKYWNGVRLWPQDKADAAVEYLKAFNKEVTFEDLFEIPVTA